MDFHTSLTVRNAPIGTATLQDNMIIFCESEDNSSSSQRYFDMQNVQFSDSDLRDGCYLSRGASWQAQFLNLVAQPVFRNVHHGPVVPVLGLVGERKQSRGYLSKTLTLL